jgi:hypothetical protein
MASEKQRKHRKVVRIVLNTRFFPCGTRVCIIKIFSYENRNPRGIIQNPNFEKDVPFENLTQLLFSMDELFDDIGNPQRTMAPRGLVRALSETREAASEEKPLATFRIDVMFRQNASWQGNFIWLDQKEESQFRSVLELIMIMDGALKPEDSENAS